MAPSPAAEPEQALWQVVVEWVLEHGWFGIAALAFVGGTAAMLMWPAPWLLLLLVPDYLVLLLLGIEWWRIRGGQLVVHRKIGRDERQVRRDNGASRNALASLPEAIMLHGLAAAVVLVWSVVGALFAWNMYALLDGTRHDTRLTYGLLAFLIGVTAVLASVLRHLAGEGLFNLTPFRDECKYADNWLSNAVQFVPLHNSPPGKAVNAALLLAMTMLAVPMALAIGTVPESRGGELDVGGGDVRVGSARLEPDGDLLCGDEAASAIGVAISDAVKAEFQRMPGALECVDTLGGSPIRTRVSGSLWEIRFFSKDTDDRTGRHSLTGLIVWGDASRPTVIEGLETPVIGLLHSADSAETLTSVSPLESNAWVQARVLMASNDSCWLSIRAVEDEAPTLVAPNEVGPTTDLFEQHQQVGRPEGDNLWRFSGPDGGTVIRIVPGSATTCPDLSILMGLAGPPA